VRPIIIPFYILIRTKRGQSFLAAQEASKIPGVKMAHTVTGTFDVILYAEANELQDIRRIYESVHQIDAVVRTETAIHT
jgi:DNA-binding Lrp family transcriptional regulator